jgi:hypothetical protein
MAATLAIGMLAAVNPAPAEAAAVDTNAWYVLVNRNSGKAVEVQGASTADGGHVVQYTDWGGANQRNSHPYRLIFAFHWRGGTAADVASGGTSGNVRLSSYVSCRAERLHLRLSVNDLRAPASSAGPAAGVIDA